MAPIPRPLIERWMEKVVIQDDPDDCWRWIGARLPKGYGVIGRGGRGTGNVGAHVFAYEHFVGPVPDGCDVDHTCFNTWCVNPKHLEAVPRNVNVHRQRSAKLTLEIADLIRSSAATNATLARHYGVDPSIISRVRRGLAWT